MTSANGSPSWRQLPYVRRHLAIGWWSLLVFLTVGIALEAMHGLKIGWYLDVSNHTRRFMFTLGHAHGTLLALMHLAFALTLGLLSPPVASWQRTASICLTTATLCLPGGFFLGGLFFWGGDPGLGILFVPVGGFLLLVAVLTTAHGIRRSM